MEPSDDYDTINRWMQSHFLRKGERWDSQNSHFDHLEQALIRLLSDLGFVEALKASSLYYKGAIVHGASLHRVQTRLQTLIQEWKRGVRFSTLFFLKSGHRLLGSDEQESTGCQDEASMTKWVWKQADVPQDMRDQVTPVFIDAPFSGERPTTADTIQAWIRIAPPGHYLAVSNAPHIYRQDLLMQHIIAQDYTVETIDSAADSPEESVMIYLDELARVLYLTSRCPPPNPVKQLERVFNLYDAAYRPHQNWHNIKRYYGSIAQKQHVQTAQIYFHARHITENDAFQIT